MSRVIYIQDMRFLRAMYDMKLSNQIENHIKGRYATTSLFECSSLVIMYKNYALIDYQANKWHHLYKDNTHFIINER